MLYQLSYGPSPTPWNPRINCSHGQGRNRTADTAVFSRVLYRLSYLAQTKRPSRRARAPAYPREATSPVDVDRVSDAPPGNHGLLERQPGNACLAPTIPAVQPSPNVETPPPGRRSSLSLQR